MATCECAPHSVHWHGACRRPMSFRPVPWLQTDTLVASSAMKSDTPAALGTWMYATRLVGQSVMVSGDDAVSDNDDGGNHACGGGRQLPAAHCSASGHAGQRAGACGAPRLRTTPPARRTEARFSRRRGRPQFLTALPRAHAGGSCASTPPTVALRRSWASTSTPPCPRSQNPGKSRCSPDACFGILCRSLLHIKPNANDEFRRRQRDRV